MVWCEHCRDHYKISHRDPETGNHQVGPGFGIEGIHLAAMKIVEALADFDPSLEEAPLPRLIKLARELVHNEWEL